MGRFHQLFLLPLLSIFFLLLSHHPSCPPCILRLTKLFSAASLARCLRFFTRTKATLLCFVLVILVFLLLLSHLPPEFPANNLNDLEFYSTGMEDDGQSWRLESGDVVEDKEVIEESVRTLELVVVKGGKEGEVVQVLDVDDELEKLGIVELNKRFDEFIEREKMKRRLEALLVSMV